jgi:hypothetical protein
VQTIFLHLEHQNNDYENNIDHEEESGHFVPQFGKADFDLFLRL